MRLPGGLDRWEILIPDHSPPSLNQTQFAHWSSVRRHKQRALDLLYVYCLQSGGIPRFTGRPRVTLTRLWGKGQRALDTVNLYGSFKPLEDAMRAQKKAGGRRDRGRGKQGGLGIIEDDSQAAVELVVQQRKNDLPGYEGRPCVLIVVEGERVE